VLNSQTSLVFKLVIKQQMPVIQISLVKMLDFKQQLLMIQISLVIMLVMGYSASFQISLVRVLVTQHQVRLVQILSVIMLGNFRCFTIKFYRLPSWCSCNKCKWFNLYWFPSW
jgi:hypothetical protein